MRIGNWLRLATTIIVLSILLAAIVASPFALRLIAKINLDWVKLSNVGQAYGAVSALLSALAFIAISLALILQARQARETRDYAITERQSALLQLGLEHPRYLEVWGGFPGPSGIDRDLIVYANLIMNYHVLWYSTHKGNDGAIRRVAAEMFDGEIGRAYCAGTSLI
jgi:hypothetical protein